MGVRFYEVGVAELFSRKGTEFKKQRSCLWWRTSTWSWDFHPDSSHCERRSEASDCWYCQPGLRISRNNFVIGERDKRLKGGEELWREPSTISMGKRKEQIEEG